MKQRHGQSVSGFVIALLLCAIPIIGFTVVYTGLASTYGVPYDNTTNGMNQYASLNATIQDMDTELHNATLSSGGFNILGDYVGYGKRVLFVTLDSIDLFSDMVDNGYENLAPVSTDPAGTAALSTIRYIIVAIVMVIVFFAIIALLMGRQST